MQWADRIGRRVKLRDLHVLQAVVQAGSMTKAAHAPAISVPVVSKAIADLEWRTPADIPGVKARRAVARCRCSYSPACGRSLQRSSMKYGVWFANPNGELSDRFSGPRLQLVQHASEPKQLPLPRAGCALQNSAQPGYFVIADRACTNTSQTLSRARASAPYWYGSGWVEIRVRNSDSNSCAANWSGDQLAGGSIS